jgi:hypothetical protein
MPYSSGMVQISEGRSQPEKCPILLGLAFSGWLLPYRSESTKEAIRKNLIRAPVHAPGGNTYYLSI